MPSGRPRRRPLPARAAGRAVAAGLVAGLAGCTPPPPPSPGPSVIVLVLDGVGAEHLAQAADAPQLWEALAPGAAIVPDALVDGATTTGPSHAALITGTRQALANLPVDLDRGAAEYRPDAPTLFEAAADQLGAASNQLLVVANSAFLEQVTRSTHAGTPAGATWDWVPMADNAGAPTHDDGDVLDVLEAAILDAPPRVALVNLHEADRAAHVSTDADFEAGLAAQDELVPAFWSWLQENAPDYAADTLLVVTADHGRHDHDLDGGWHNHGDACRGCRSIPMWFVGAGVAAGGTPPDPVSLLDLAPTLAGHLGVELPFAEGLPLPTLVEGDAAVRSGPRDLALSATHEAEADFLDDPAARSEVRLDGEVVSAADAIYAEAPVLAEADGVAFACFRELRLDRAAPTQSWSPRCLRDTGTGWADVGFPVAEVDAWWRPALSVSGGVLSVSWAHNPYFTLEDPLGQDIGVRSATWSATAGWQDEGRISALVPTGLTRADRTVAWAESTDPVLARYTRRLRVASLDGGSVAVDAVVDDALRVETPALSAVDGTLFLGFLANEGEGWRPWVATSTDGGATWSDAATLATDGEPVLDPPPAWRGGTLYWFAETEDEALVCQGGPTVPTTCTGLGSPRVRAAALTPDRLDVILDLGTGQWARRSLE